MPKYSNIEGIVCQGQKRILSLEFRLLPPYVILDNYIVKWYSFVNGELSERFKEPVLKTGDSERNLGFESLTLRQSGLSDGQSAFSFRHLLDFGLDKAIFVC